MGRYSYRVSWLSGFGVKIHVWIRNGLREGGRHVQFANAIEKEELQLQK